MPQLINVVVDYTTDGEARGEMDRAWEDLDIQRELGKWIAEKEKTYTGNDQDLKYHEAGRDGIAVVIAAATGGATTVKNLKKGVDYVKGLAQKVKKGKVGTVPAKFAKFGRLLSKLDELENLVPGSKQRFLDDFADAADDVLESLGGNPDLVDSWKVLDEANVPKALRSDSEKLTKANRYLDNNPTKKDGFIDDLKKTSDPEKFVDKTSRLDDIGQQYGLDFDDFVPQGISKANVPQQLYDNMLNGYSDALSPQLKEKFLKQLIESGSNVPAKVPLSQGDELFKVIPKGNELTQSSFYMSKSELDKLKAVGELEQKLGLPLGSHSVEYDVYKAVAKESVDVFESTVAPTLQKGYQTTGGATQTFILNSTKWDITKVETILP